MTRFVLLQLAFVAAVASGCSLIVDEQLANKGSDAGPTGPSCNTTEQCLMLSGREFDCTQTCVGAAPGSPGVCVSGGATPDGTPCGVGGTRICSRGGMCEPSACGDGFVDRTIMPAEFCDDGDTNDGNQCSNSCTRSCVPPAPAECGDGDPCNGVEMCDTGAGVCRTTRRAPDGTECMVGADPGACRAGTCVVE